MLTFWRLQVPEPTHSEYSLTMCTQVYVVAYYATQIHLAYDLSVVNF